MIVIKRSAAVVPPCIPLVELSLRPSSWWGSRRLAATLLAFQASGFSSLDLACPQILELKSYRQAVSGLDESLCHSWLLLTRSSFVHSKVSYTRSAGSSGGVQAWKGGLSQSGVRRNVDRRTAEWRRHQGTLGQTGHQYPLLPRQVLGQVCQEEGAILFQLKLILSPRRREIIGPIYSGKSFRQEQKTSGLIRRMIF